MHCQTLIDTLLAENHAIKKRLEERLRPLETHQWTWRPEPSSWSVAEALEHLQITFDAAFGEVEPELDKAINAGLKPTETYAVGWIGELAVQMMDNSDNRRYSFKFKTSKALEPQVDDKDIEELLNSFLIQLSRFSGLLEKSRLVPLGKVRIRLLPGSFIRFRLGDTLRFFSAHTQRHLTQIERIIAQEGFPQTVSSGH